MSPRHGSIELADGVPVVVSDMGSTYVNQLKVSTRRIAHRDEISIGDADFLVICLDAIKDQAPT